MNQLISDVRSGLRLLIAYPTLSLRGIGAEVLPYATAIFGPEVFGLQYTMLAAE
jgi:hypothetical protein